MVSSSSVVLRTVAVDVVDEDENFSHGGISFSAGPAGSDELLLGEELGELGCRRRPRPATIWPCGARRALA